ncbi:TPA: restriction endonuclease subunit S [Pseudomonas putida]|nr:restriction endonuclease subunit S [Pseudomonas putida]HEN8715711.1 restriction endonuclease subunit S [Pseudomonas putida]
MEMYYSYPKYKSSGDSWLGDIPEHWTARRSDFVIDTNRRQVSADSLNGVDVIHYSIPNVQEYGRGVVEGGDKVDSAKLLIIEEQLLVSKLNPRKSTLCIAKPDDAYRVVASSEFVPILPGKANLRYAYYLWGSDKVTKLLSSMVQSVTRSHQRVNPADILKLHWAWPTLDEQQTIARFLDFKTAQIDALIAKKISLLDKLAEKRMALISHAVTKGLDQSLPMKSSGVEWIGDIPRHWSIRRMKFAAKLESGHTPSKQVPEYWEDCDIPWVSLNDSKQLAAVDYISETAIQINSLGLANSSARLLPANAVVFTRDATIGLCAITTRPMAVSQHLIAWIPGLDITSLYLLRVFSAMKGFLDSFTFGATIKTIGMPDVKRLAMPIPPKNEQKAITAFIDEQLRTISPQIQAIETAIDKLTEYRSALITGAVTGKIDVRGFGTPQRPEGVAS